MERLESLEDRLAIQDLNQRYAVHVDLHEIDKWVDLFTQDAVFDEREFGTPLMTGHDAIRALVEKESAGMQAAGVMIELNDDDKAAASGDLGWHSGSYVVKDASGAVVDSGNYLAVMQKQADGKWLMIRDTWNSDRPPPAPPAAEPAADAAAEAPAT